MDKTILTDKMKIYIWEDLDVMSDSYHSDGGVVVIAKSLSRARKLVLADCPWLGSEGSGTVLNTKPTLQLNCEAKAERIFYFPNAGCC